MPTRSVVFAILLAMAVQGCGKAAGPNAQAPVQMAQAGHGGAGAGADQVPSPVTRKLIVTADLSITVDDFAAALAKMNSLAETLQEQGGYLSSQQSYGSGSNCHHSWTIRVPMAGFDQLVKEIEALGEVIRSSQQAQDVTEEFVDLEARLKNKLASEQRLMSHLDQSAKLADTLELERELSRVRGEIEQMQGKLNLLKNRSDLGTINVTLFERTDVVLLSQPQFGTILARSFNQSWHLLIRFLQVLLLIMVSLIPWAVCAMIVASPWVLIRRFRKRQKRASQVA